jgi:hypothetical protein
LSAESDQLSSGELADEAQGEHRQRLDLHRRADAQVGRVQLGVGAEEDEVVAQRERAVAVELLLQAGAQGVLEAERVDPAGEEVGHREAQIWQIRLVAPGAASDEDARHQ